MRPVSYTHLIVCVKQVPDTTEINIDHVTNTLIRAGVPSIVNPYDAYALETALRLKERYGAEVLVISMGCLLYTSIAKPVGCIPHGGSLVFFSGNIIRLIYMNIRHII